MMFTKLLWDKLVEGARRNPDSELAGLVQALDRAFEEDREQPFEVAFRMLKMRGPTLRVAVEDLGKLIHDYNNALVVRQSLELEVRELTERLERSAGPARRTSSCPPAPAAS